MNHLYTEQNSLLPLNNSLTNRWITHQSKQSTLTQKNHHILHQSTNQWTLNKQKKQIYTSLTICQSSAPNTLSNKYNNNNNSLLIGKNQSQALQIQSRQRRRDTKIASRTFCAVYKLSLNSQTWIIKESKSNIWNAEKQSWRGSTDEYCNKTLPVALIQKYHSSTNDGKNWMPSFVHAVSLVHGVPPSWLHPLGRRERENEVPMERDWILSSSL